MVSLQVRDLLRRIWAPLAKRLDEVTLMLLTLQVERIAQRRAAAATTSDVYAASVVADVVGCGPSPPA
jgi:hypothetical protein